MSCKVVLVVVVKGENVMVMMVGETCTVVVMVLVVLRESV